MRRPGFSKLTLMLIIAVLCSFVQGRSSEAEGATLETVRVCSFSLASVAPFFVGMDKGYFARYGVDIDFIPMTSGGTIATNTAAGHCDVGSSSGAVIFNALHGEFDLKIVSTVTQQALEGQTGDTLVIRRDHYDAGLRSVRDLKNKVVAVNARGVATNYELDWALRREGLTISDVQLAIISFPDMPGALRNHAVDAAVMADPFGFFAVEEGYGEWLVPDLNPGGQVLVMLMNANFIDRKRPLASGVIAGFLQAARELAEGGWEDEANILSISRYTNMEPGLVKRVAKPYVNLTGEINLADVEAQQRFFFEQGMLNYDTLLDITDHIDYGPLRDALALIEKDERR